MFDQFARVTTPEAWLVPMPPVKVPVLVDCARTPGLRVMHGTLAGHGEDPACSCKCAFDPSTLAQDVGTLAYLDPLNVAAGSGRSRRGDATGIDSPAAAFVPPSSAPGFSRPLWPTSVFSAPAPLS